MSLSKRIITIITIAISGLSFSQVIIGDAIGTVPANQKSSVLLEFAAGQNKGIILPYVKTLPSGTNVTEGTILLDASIPTKAKIKYYNGVVNTDSPDGWVDLSSRHEADITTAMSAQPASVVEDPAAKAIIGANTSSAKGVLVLESNTKAMVLPMVNSTDDVPDPAPGMMVYINKSGSKRLAVYNGGGWTYWKSL